MRSKNRESTDERSKYTVGKRTIRLEKRISLNKQNIFQSQIGRDQVSGGVNITCWHTTPIANVEKEFDN